MELVSFDIILNQTKYNEKYSKDYFLLICCYCNSLIIEEGQEPTFGTPESHVWEMVGVNSAVSCLYNKQTGEVRKYASVV